MTAVSRLLPLSAVLLAAGCDPAFMYAIPGARTIQSNGLHYVLDAGDGIEARFHGSVFTSRGHVVIQVVNRSAESIEFRSTPISITYGAARPVDYLRCQASPPDERVIIHPGAKLEIQCGFSAVPAGYNGRGYDPALRYLRIDQGGFSRAGRPFAIGATMEWSN